MRQQSFKCRIPLRRFRRCIWGISVLLASAATTSLLTLSPVCAILTPDDEGLLDLDQDSSAIIENEIISDLDIHLEDLTTYVDYQDQDNVETNLPIPHANIEINEDFEDFEALESFIPHSEDQGSNIQSLHAQTSQHVDHSDTNTPEEFSHNQLDGQEEEPPILDFSDKATAELDSVPDDNIDVSLFDPVLATLPDVILTTTAEATDSDDIIPVRNEDDVNNTTELLRIREENSENDLIMQTSVHPQEYSNETNDFIIDGIEPTIVETRGRNPPEISLAIESPLQAEGYPGEDYSRESDVTTSRPTQSQIHEDSTESFVTEYNIREHVPLETQETAEQASNVEFSDETETLGESSPSQTDLALSDRIVESTQLSQDEPIKSIMETKEMSNNGDGDVLTHEAHNQRMPPIPSATDTTEIVILLDETISPRLTTEARQGSALETDLIVGQTVMDVPPASNVVEKVVPEPEDSLANFFAKVNAKKQSETGKLSKAKIPSTSFEALASQQEQMNLILESRESKETTESQLLPTISPESYSGLPWGIFYGPSRHLPDLELLYHFFKDRINADESMHRVQPMARFPLSMGKEHTVENSETLADQDLDILFSFHQEKINTLLEDSENAMKNLGIDADPFNKKEESSIPVPNDLPLDGKYEHLPHLEAYNRNLKGSTSDDLVEGLDDIEKFFQSVDPPDELDVGAASGSSMQELIMGKGREILVKRVTVWYRFVYRIVSATKDKILLQSSSLKKATFKMSDLSDFMHQFDLKEMTSRLQTITKNVFKVVAEFFDDLIDREEDTGGDSSNIDDFDFDAIRKMSGLDQLDQ